MSSISIIAHTIWSWLPDLTVGLRFATALIGFYPTVTLMIHRLRHRMRRCGSHHPSRVQKEKTPRPAQADAMTPPAHQPSRHRRSHRDAPW